MLRVHRLTALLALLVACAAGALLSSQGALALFSDSGRGGPQTIESSTLAPPANPSGEQIECRKNKAPEVSISWSASNSEYASGYTVERALSATGPYTALAGFGAAQRTYTDSSSLSYSTTYYYRVSATYRQWSASATPVSVKTTNKNCLGG